MSKRYFINNLNTFVGQALVDEVRNDHEEEEDPNIIIGTLLDRDDTERPPGIRKVLKRTKPNLFRKYLLDCDVLIYDLHNGDIEEVEFALKALKEGEYEEEKTLVLVSSVMVWAETPLREKLPKVKKSEGDGDGEEEGEEQAAAEGDGEGEEEEEVKDDDLWEMTDLEEEEEEAEDEEKKDGEVEEGEEGDERNETEGTENPEKSSDKKAADTKADPKAAAKTTTTVDSDSDNEQDESGEEKPEEEEVKPVKPKRKFFYFKETDYQSRVPSPKFHAYKSVEDSVLSITTLKENLKVYVIASGVMYGNGETVFNEQFKRAWLQSPSSLKYIGEGDNFIPTVHVKDLSRFVKKVSETKPEQPYLLCIDETVDGTQKNIIDTISKGVGTGLTESLPLEDSLLEENADIFTVNLRMKPSSLLIGEEADFEWWSQKGLMANIDKVLTEFNSHRGLKPIKVFISGPPACGKSHFANLLSSHFNIPHVNITDVIKEVTSQEEEGDPLALEVTAALKELKDKMIEEAEKTKKKKEQLDYSKFNPRVPDEMLFKIFQWKLGQNACKNRGYVLDGYPRTYDDAKGVFYVPEKKEKVEGDEEAEEEVVEAGEEKDENEEGEEGEVEKEPVKLLLAKDMLPQSVIVIKGTDDELKERVKNLPEEKVEGTHYNEEGMTRRLAVYREANSSDERQPVDYFFQEMGTELYECETEIDEPTQFENFRIYIERTGRPYNYLESVEELNKQREEFLAKKESEKQSRLLAEADKTKQQEEEERRERERRDAERLEKLKEHEKELLDSRSLPLRQYLMENVVPIVTEGLIEICKFTPDDPADFLAEYLYKKSSELREQRQAELQKELAKQKEANEEQVGQKKPYQVLFERFD